jgi:excisionase family DNA binding protein
MKVASQELLTVEEIARRLRTRPNNVRQWVVRGRLRAVQRGNGLSTEYLIPEDELRRFILEGMR